MCRCSFWGHLSCLVFSEFPGSVFWCLTDINLGEILSHYCFKYCFCSFLFLPFLVLPLCVCYTFCSCPTVLGYSVPFFKSICVCVCVYIYTHTHTHTHTYIYIYIFFFFFYFFLFSLGSFICILKPCIQRFFPQPCLVYY